MWGTDHASSSPPPDRCRLFSENQKGCGFGQRAILAGKIALQILDPLLLFPCGLAHSGRARAVPVVRLLTGPAPRLDLLGKKPALAAIFGHVSLIHRRRLQHRRELVARCPALRANCSIRQELAIPARLSPPLVQRCLRYSLVL